MNTRTALLSLACLCCFPFPSISQEDVSNPNKPVPDAVIESIRSWEPGTPNGKQLNQLNGLLAPDTLLGNLFTGLDEDEGTMESYFGNFDDDPEEELVVLCAWLYYAPRLLVMDQVGGKWRLIFDEGIYVHYNPTQLVVSDAEGPAKTFGVRYLYSRGSGVFQDAMHFYKLIDGEVRLVLDIANEAQIHGWGLSVNQDTRSSFEYVSTDRDEIHVTYNYRYFPGPIFESDLSWESHDSICLVCDSGTVVYAWNKRAGAYQHQETEEPGTLTPDQVASFDQLGNDSLFVEAFSSEIAEKLQSGTEGERQVLLQIMSDVAERKSSPMEKKGEAGGLEFYGPKGRKE